MKLNALPLCLCLLPLLLGAAPKPHKAPLKELKKKHAAAKAKLHDLKVKAHKIQRAARNVRGDINSIDSQISGRMQEIDGIQARLAVNLKRQVALAKELAVATARLKVRSEQARREFREMYMQGDATLASALVGTSDLGDLASREFICERIAERDRQLFEDVKELQQNVVVKTAQNNAVIIQNKKDEEDEKTAEAELQDEREEKTQALQDLKNQEGKLEQLIHQLDEEDAQTFDEIQAYEAGPGRVLGAFHGRFMVPVYGARLSSPFGMRYHPILHRMRMHTGQDFAAPRGTPIHATADGIVISCRYMSGYGNAIIVDHGGGYASLYGHCSQLIARPGQHVRQGEVIALVGSTGLATGPHCHFEIRIKWAAGKSHAVPPLILAEPVKQIHSKKCGKKVRLAHYFGVTIPSSCRII